jgi:hypothetical protein
MAAEIYKGGIKFFSTGVRFTKNAGVMSFSGTPTNGAAGTGVGKFGKGTIGIDYTNGVLYFNTGTKASPTWVGIAILGGSGGQTTAILQVSPANPTATSSATYVMMGLGAAASPALITPNFSTRLLIEVSGNITATNAQTATLQLVTGVGAPPANAAATPGGGTAVGNQPTFTGLTGALTGTFSVQAIVSGATPLVANWIDIQLKSSSGAVSITNLSVTANEI